MITPRLRPRFDARYPVEPAALIARVEERLRDPRAACQGLLTEDQIELRIHPRARRFWSPQLVVRVEDDGGETVASGRFGPDAHVWSLFLAIYAFVVIAAGFAMMWGIAQLMLDEAPWAFLAAPAALVLIALIYSAAGVGQRLGHEQTEVLLRCLEDSAGEPLPRGERAEP